MKSKVLSLALLTFMAFQAISQEVVLKNMEDSLRVGWWDRSTQLAINFSQASFNDAWQGGGVNNFALGFLFGNKADFTKAKGKFSSDIQFQYGFLNNKGQGTRKSVDRLFLDGKYSRAINDKWSWFAGANFISQFAGGYTYNSDNSRGNLISSLISPGYLSEGLGIDYTPSKHFKVSLGGATLRQTFVLNEEVFNNNLKENNTAFGINQGSKVLTELGFQVVAAYNKDILPNVNLSWRYQGFQAFTPLEKTLNAQGEVTKKSLKALDHNINLILAAKVNKYMNVNFSLIGTYDDDVINKFQISQGLAAGLAFNL